MPQHIATLIENHFGAITGVLLLLFFAVMYVRGEMPAFFTFLRLTLTDEKTGQPSTKSMGYLAGLGALCWSFAKLTLATCRWIDKGGDPSMLFLGELTVIAGLVGIVYYGAKKLQQADPVVPPVPSAQPGGGQ